jgi:catechol 2,3-dioxygenase-like lactoylglutathione lyase family enzyme
MIKTAGLCHLNLNVRDLEASTRFYQEVFGLELLHRYEGPMGKHPHGRQVALSTPGQRDILALSQVEGEPVGPGGLNHLGFLLANDDDLDDAIRQVERAGGKLVRAETVDWDGIREKLAYVTDPDGYVIELNAQKILLSKKRER